MGIVILSHLPTLCKPWTLRYNWQTMGKIRKAIIPVGGLGTRFLPATKAQPKEMLPIVDKPIIQYIVEEAVASGIEHIIFVTAIGKRAIEDHFDRNFELEYRLEQKKKQKELAAVAKIGKLAKFAFVRQSKPMGDGHAVLSALPFIEEHEPVAVLFGDDIVVGKPGDKPRAGKPALQELLEIYARYEDPVVALERVPRKDVSRFGVIGGTQVSAGVWEVETLIEKPSAREAPSNLAIIGKYILTPEVLKILTKIRPGRDGEVRIADALARFIKGRRSLYGVALTGTRYDCGNKLGFLMAQVELGLRHPEVSKQFRDYLKKLKI